MVLTDLANVINFVYNDVRYVHLHAIGDKFDSLHGIAKEYYEQLQDDYDTIAEKALELGEEVLALNNLNNDDWTIPQGNYPFHEGIEFMYHDIDYLIETLSSIRADPKYACCGNLLDQIIDYWSKENNFKNKARLA